MRHEIALPPITIEGEEYPDYPGIAIWYAEKAVSGEILVCRMLKLAAQRFLRMLETAEKGKFKRGETFYAWSPEDVVDVCDFEEKLPHVEGYTGNLVLQPWQIWENAAIWGFRRDTGARLVRLVSEWIPRKHGKSFRSATRGHFIMNCEGEIGPLGYICAAVESQADKVFDPMSKLVDNCADFREYFGAKATLTKITYANGGKIQKLSHIGEHQDGHNPHWVCMEELHAQKPDVYKVMRSALRSRRNPMFWTISTAGRRAHGIGWDMWKFCERILEGHLDAPHVFAMIANADQEDIDAKRLGTIDAVRKANPNFSVSIDPGILEEYEVETKGTPSGSAEFLRTTFNIWSRSAGNLVSGEQWDACLNADLKLEDFGKRDEAFIAADLASRSDLAAVSVMFERGKNVQFFSRYYICEDAEAFQIEEYADLYNQWREQRVLTITPGGYIDFGVIEADIVDLAARFDTVGITLDDYQANQMLANLVAADLPATVFQKRAKFATEPTDEILSRIRAKRFEHDGNPITRWCAMNVVGYWDELGQVLPKKDKTRPNDKIDGFDTLVMANALRLSPDRPKRKRPSVYETRGLWGWDDDRTNADGARHPA